MSTAQFTRPVNRRHFLSISGLALGWLAVAPMVSALDKFSTDLKIGAKTYRGTSDGRILLSTDKGQTWNGIANFGNAVIVEALTTNGAGVVKAQLRNDQHLFWVQSSNDRTWLTENYRAPTKP